MDNGTKNMLGIIAFYIVLGLVIYLLSFISVTLSVMIVLFLVLVFFTMNLIS